MNTHKKLLQYAAEVAKHSDDPRTHVGAIVYDIETTKGLWRGVNQFSDGFISGDLEKYSKYPIMLHAEQAALYGYLRYGHVYNYIGLAVTAACCTECAKAIVAAGVEEVVTSKKAIEAMPNWKEQIELGHEILRRGRVELILVDDVGAEVLIGGEQITI